MANVTVVLVASNMGDSTTEADFDSWIAYVSERIDAACGFVVDVDSLGFRDSADRDGIKFEESVDLETRDEQIATIREALARLWEAWCGGERAGADVETDTSIFQGVIETGNRRAQWQGGGVWLLSEKTGSGFAHCGTALGAHNATLDSLFEQLSEDEG